MAIQLNFNQIKNEIKENLRISMPLMSSQVIYACSGFIGTAMVAHLGEDALAASVLVSMIWMTLSVLFFGMLNSVSVLVAHQYGAKNNQAISEIMGQSFILGIIVSIFIILLLLSMPLFLQFTKQPLMVKKLSLEYMFSLLWTIPGLILLIIYEQFLAGINRAKIVLRISMIVVPVEITIIYAFIFGKFGLPKLGVAGVGYGFTVTYTLTALLMTFYFLRSKYYAHFGIFERLFKLDWHYLKELIVIGLPMGFMHTIEVGAFTVMTFWISRISTTLLAAHQISLQYIGFAITIVFAMSQAVTVRVGHAVGRLDLNRIYYASYVGMGMNFAIMLVIAFAFVTLPDFFLHLDVNVYDPRNKALVEDATGLLRICGVLMLFDNFRIISFGALRGVKDTQFPMYASLLSFWVVGLSLAYLFGFTFHFSGKGIWWGITLGIAFGALLFLARLNYLLKRIDLNQLMQKSSSANLLH